MNSETLVSEAKTIEEERGEEEEEEKEEGEEEWKGNDWEGERDIQRDRKTERNKSISHILLLELLTCSVSVTAL